MRPAGAHVRPIFPEQGGFSPLPGLFLFRRCGGEGGLIFNLGLGTQLGEFSFDLFPFFRVGEVAGDHVPGRFLGHRAGLDAGQDQYRQLAGLAQGHRLSRVHVFQFRQQLARQFFGALHRLTPGDRNAGGLERLDQGLGMLGLGNQALNLCLVFRRGADHQLLQLVDAPVGE